MTDLSTNSWGKSSVRVSKIHRGQDADDFSEVTVSVALTGDVEAAYVNADNVGVLPTDTVRNTTYALAQDNLTKDLEAFAEVLATHFLGHAGVDSVTVDLVEHLWRRQTESGFIGGSAERRTARRRAAADAAQVWGGIEGLMVLKTRESAFSGFPRDQYTILPETDDRILATTVGAEWLYAPVPADTTAAWEAVRAGLVGGFFGDWSGSIQHQGWQMAEAVMAAVPEIAELSVRLPNQHHLAYDLSRFEVEDKGIVFQSTSEPYGDIRFTVTR
ncbi:MAG: factor-independent urate hydroxylase [Acidimicrobiia bacterium]